MNAEAIRRMVQAQEGEFWQVIDGALVPYLHHRRAAYHDHLPWDQHPWSDSHEPGWGKDFRREWAMETETDGRWSADGRNDGVYMPIWLQQENIFDTELAARRYLIDKLRRYADSTRERAHEYERALFEQLAILSVAGER